jgi:hypothetical protein
MGFQSVLEKRLVRSDHAWHSEARRGLHKCCLCGAITHETPPDFPTDKTWMPERYEKLTEEDRELVRLRR